MTTPYELLALVAFVVWCVVCWLMAGPVVAGLFVALGSVMVLGTREEVR